MTRWMNRAVNTMLWTGAPALAAGSLAYLITGRAEYELAAVVYFTNSLVLAWVWHSPRGR